MAIQFVYFDLGNVLVRFDPQIMIGNIAARFNVAAVDVEHAIFHTGLQDHYEHGRVSNEQYAASVRETLGFSESQMPTDALLQAGSDMFTPIESMARTIDSVCNRGVGVGILSNTCDAHWNWIAQQAWYVTEVPWLAKVFSFRVGAMKPQIEIYEAAERLAKVPVSDLLFLDDREENVAAARQRGWHAVQCFGGDQAEQTLRQFAVVS